MQEEQFLYIAQKKKSDFQKRKAFLLPLFLKKGYLFTNLASQSTTA